MTQIFNARKLNQDFGAYASNLVNFIYGNREVEDHNIANLELANKMLYAGALTSETNGPGWPHYWYINMKWFYTNGYLTEHGQEEVPHFLRG